MQIYVYFLIKYVAFPFGQISSTTISVTISWANSTLLQATVSSTDPTLTNPANNKRNGTVYTWTQTLTDRTFEWNTAFRIHGIQAMPTTTNDYQWTQESELEAQNGGGSKTVWNSTALQTVCTAAQYSVGYMGVTLLQFL